MTITFLFNQLTHARLGSGGDIKGHHIYQRAAKDTAFRTSVIAPHYAIEHFPESTVHTTGHSLVEHLFFKSTSVPSFLIAYIMRTIETTRLLRTVNTDALYTTGDFFCNSIPAYWYKRARPHITVATCVYHLNESPLKRKRNFFARAVISHSMQQISFWFIKRSADIVYVLNEGMKKELQQRGFKNTIVISHAGVDTETLQTQLKTLPPTPQKKQLVFFNRVNPTKGVYDLPKVLASVREKYPSIHLDIIGSIDPSMRRNLTHRFAEKGCADAVTFHGFVKDKADVLRLLTQGTVFLQPSYEEGWSIVLFEAILTGCMPVVYDLPVYREVFGDRLYTAATGDTTQMARHITDILQLNDARYQEIMEQLQEIASHYDWQHVYTIEKEALFAHQA